ncbi:MAG: YHS domain-containing (seleno)protein [Bdellovibrionales bacterium]
MFKFIILLASFLLPFSIFAKPLYSENGIYIDGYDPVSYLKSNTAKKGKKEISIEHRKLKIYFSSEENKKLFVSEPEKYSIAYGGYCAYAMAKSGDLVSVDPETFKVINGKVYLFYNAFFIDTLKKWNKLDESVQLKQANSRWKDHETVEANP